MIQKMVYNGVAGFDYDGVFYPLPAPEWFLERVQKQAGFSEFHKSVFKNLTALATMNPQIIDCDESEGMNNLLRAFHTYLRDGVQYQVKQLVCFQTGLDTTFWETRYKLPAVVYGDDKIKSTTEIAILDGDYHVFGLMNFRVMGAMNKSDNFRKYLEGTRYFGLTDGSRVYNARADLSALIHIIAYAKTLGAAVLDPPHDGGGVDLIKCDDHYQLGIEIGKHGWYSVQPTLFTKRIDLSTITVVIDVRDRVLASIAVTLALSGVHVLSSIPPIVLMDLGFKYEKPDGSIITLSAPLLVRTENNAQEIWKGGMKCLRT